MKMDYQVPPNDRQTNGHDHNRIFGDGDGGRGKKRRTTSRTVAIYFLPALSSGIGAVARLIACVWYERRVVGAVEGG